MKINCPYCGEAINDSAVVCAHCGAYESTSITQGGQGTGCFLLILMGGWLMYGPGTIYIWATNGFDAKDAWIALGTGAVVTFLGFFVLRFLMRAGTKRVWYRRRD